MTDDVAARRSTAAEAGDAAYEGIGVVVIGRNEGERLIRCLDALSGAGVLVYVDSGSSDGSPAAARARGIAVVELPVPPAFTAARARNAGIDALLARHPTLAYIQTIDGDCEIVPGWFTAAVSAIEREPDLAAVFGRLRERHPERSAYNALCDAEWNVPVGSAASCGGIALFRAAALSSVGGYRQSMIAGEEPDMCLRMRKQRWRIERIDADMALHDADILRFAQWWRRTTRSGHAFAELAHLHQSADAPEWRRACRSIVIWGGAAPLLLLIAAIAAICVQRDWAIAALALIAGWSLQVLRIAWRTRRDGFTLPLATTGALLLMVGKVAQIGGMFRYHRNRLAGRGSQLIEY